MLDPACTVNKVVPVYAMKEHGEGETKFHSFLTWKLNGMEWSALRPSHFNH